MSAHTAILIPVKATTRAKGRLADLLDQATRQELAVAMLKDVLAAVTPTVSCLANAIYVTTSDPTVMAVASGYGAEVLEEHAQRSESASVDAASRECVRRGVRALLTLPADVPAIRTDDVAAILTQATSDRALVLVPARDGRGTNAIWRRPPDAIPSRFGFESFRKHQVEAEARGISWAAVTLPRVALDLDEPEDVAAFLELPGATRTHALLERVGLAARFHPVAEPGISLASLPGMPEVAEGDDLVGLILAAARCGGGLRTGDVLVIAQKVVSKAEGRVVSLASVVPSARAREFAEVWGKDARHVEVVLREAQRIVRMERGIIIAETKHGFVCANAGVDVSNVPGEDRVCLLPIDPDGSARRLRQALAERSGAEVAVIISDTFGRPWREGLTNVAIGVAGLRPLESYIGRRDPHGHILRATELAIADELAVAAGLVMGKLARIPTVRIRGYRYPPGDGLGRALVRPADRDLFR